MGKKKSIQDILRPFDLYKSLLGLTVFEMPIGCAWTKLSIVYATIKMTLYAYCFWLAQLSNRQAHYIVPMMTNVVHLIIYSNIAISVVSTISGFVHYKKIKRFEKRIALVDETLKAFGIDPDYDYAFKKITVAIVIWCAAVNLVFGLDLARNYYKYGDIYQSFLKVIAFQTPLILNLTIEFNFAVMISILGKRFERVNTLIQSVGSTNSLMDRLNDYKNYQNIMNKIEVTTENSCVDVKNIKLVLKIVRQVHLDLCQISHKVNDTCSKQMTLQMGATFILLTGFSYFIYVIHTRSTPANNILVLCTLGIWILYSILRILYLVRVSVNVMEEAQRTTEIAYEIRVLRREKKVMEEIHQLSLQLMQHPLRFTASGLIVLDFNYVRRFVGSITTYLMILIQSQPDVIDKAAMAFSRLSRNYTTLSLSK